MSAYFRKVKCNNKGCSLFTRGDFVPCEVLTRKKTEKADILLVGAFPEINDGYRREPFSSNSGQLVRNAMRHAMRGRKPLNIAYSNSTRCVPTEDDETLCRVSDIMDSQSINYCKRFLEKDIEDLDPEVIVILGSAAAQSILKHSVNLPSIRGKVTTQEVFGKQRSVFYTWTGKYLLNNSRLLPLFNSEMKSIIDHVLDEHLYIESSGDKGECKVLTTVTQVENYLTKELMGLKKTDVVATDVETRNLNKKFDNDLVMIQFAHNADVGTCIPLHHGETPFTPDELVRVFEMLNHVFTSKDVPFSGWIAHNSMFEQALIGHHILDGSRIRNKPVLDTQGGAYLLDENRVALRDIIKGVFSLKQLLREWLGFDHYDSEDMAVRNAGGLHKLPLMRLADYGAMDAYGTWRLFQYESMMAAEQNYYNQWIKLLAYLFSPVYKVLSTIEVNGFYVNRDHLWQLKDNKNSIINSRLTELEKQLRTFKSAKQANKIALSRLNKKKGPGEMKPLFGNPWVLNMNSNIDALFVDVLQMRAEKTKTGQWAIGKDFFTHNEGVPEVDLVSEWRQLSKLSGGFVKQIHKFVNPENGHPDCIDSRVRPSFWFDSTVTGRTASSKPNMQQVPKTEGHPARIYIKSLFQAEQPNENKVVDIRKAALSKGRPSSSSPPIKNALVQLDFMASEVRWWCLMSKDETLATAFINGKKFRQEYAKDPTNLEKRKQAELAGDIHKMTASLMFGVPVDKVVKEMRSATKSIVFGWMYGRSIKSIAEQIGKSIEETEVLCAQFSAKFPRASAWLEFAEETAADNLFIDSPIGRRRRLAAFMSGNDWLLAEAKRLARNSPIQSISSDAAMIGSSLFADWIEDNNKPWKIINSVHDSSVTELPIEDIPEMVAVAQDIYERGVEEYITEHWGFDFCAPIEVEFEISQAPRHGWGDLIKWDFSPPHLERIIRGAKDPVDSLFIWETHINKMLEKQHDLTGHQVVSELNVVYPNVYNDYHADKFEKLLAQAR